MAKKRTPKNATELGKPEAPLRRFPRIPAQTSVLLRRLGGPLKGELSTTKVLGLGGCSFIHGEPQKEGATLYLSILLGMDLAEAKVRVVYERPLEDGTFEIGVEFLEIAPRDLELLERLAREAGSASAGT